MSMSRVISCIAGRGCLLLPVCFLDKTQLAFALLHFLFQGQTCLLLQVSFDFLHWNSNPLWWKGHLLMLVLEGLVVIHKTIPIQVLWHPWSGHGLGLLWCWMICLGKEPRSFLCFWDCIQVLHFSCFCWLWGLPHFFKGILAYSSGYNGHVN